MCCACVRARASAHLCVLGDISECCCYLLLFLFRMRSDCFSFLLLRQVRVSNAPLEGFDLGSAQLALGVGLYAWIGYYACCFLPYRTLYHEYQSYQRRIAQVLPFVRSFVRSVGLCVHVRVCACVCVYVCACVCVFWSMVCALFRLLVHLGAV